MLATPLTVPRLAIRVHDRKTYGLEHQVVPITPLAQLPRRPEFRANSPLDALVQFCDTHAWRVVSLPPITYPPVPMDGVIRPDDNGDPRTAVRVTPLAVACEQLADGGFKYAGTYRVELLPSGLQ